jgi:hypothetical protein
MYDKGGYPYFHYKMSTEHTPFQGGDHYKMLTDTVDPGYDFFSIYVIFWAEHVHSLF